MRGTKKIALVSISVLAVMFFTAVAVKAEDVIVNKFTISSGSEDMSVRGIQLLGTSNSNIGDVTLIGDVKIEGPVNPTIGGNHFTVSSGDTITLNVNAKLSISYNFIKN